MLPSHEVKIPSTSTVLMSAFLTPPNKARLQTQLLFKLLILLYHHPIMIYSEIMREFF